MNDNEKWFEKLKEWRNIGLPQRVKEELETERKEWHP